MFSSPRDLQVVAQDLTMGYFGHGKLFSNPTLYTDMMHAEFVDFDPHSGFGMPFETLSLNTYNVYRKGGNAGNSSFI